MPKFMIAYHGGTQPRSTQAALEQMENWKAWIANLGDVVVNSGTPLTSSKIVTSGSVESDVDPHSMHGFAVVKAENIDAAIEIAKSDPFLHSGGKIRVSQMIEMTP